MGVFALGAVAAGALSLETLQRLEVYLVAFAAAALLLAFVLLPLLVTAVTPFRYREVVGIAQDALLTAFVANNAFIVLPILAERSKELMARHGLLSPDADSAAELLVPILFNFPNAGRLLTLLFVPFAAWLAGSPLPAGRYAALFAVGVPSYFAKAQVALPFLMDVFDLPHDLFDLYLPTTILSGKFDSLVTAMNLLVFALLGGAAMGGFLTLRKRRLLTAAATMAAGTLATVLAVRPFLGASVDTSYHRDEALRRMHAPRGAVAVLLRDREALRREPPPDGATVLERVRARGALRVGCDPANAPFSFVNAEGQLVGLDVELAQQLGEALGVRAEFVPVGWHEVPQVLGDGLIDVVPSLWYRPFWFPTVRLTAPYLSGTIGLVVPDARRDEFARIEDLRRSRGLRIGVPLDRSQLDVSVKRYFGEAQVDIVPLDAASTFLEGRAPGLDAFLMPAESASAATLLHPQFSVVVPQPDPVRIPMAFGVAPEARDLADAIDEWVVFATSVDSPRLAYDYWILGQGARDEKPRWSILRDVLGWEGPPERR